MNAKIPNSKIPFSYYSVHSTVALLEHADYTYFTCRTGYLDGSVNCQMILSACRTVLWLDDRREMIRCF
jgi:hypothetical protein